MIAYQIRQSFKPGEVTLEEANRIGYETAMRWTKGKQKKKLPVSQLLAQLMSSTFLKRLSRL